MGFEKAPGAVKVIKDQIQYRSQSLLNLARGYFSFVIDFYFILFWVFFLHFSRIFQYKTLFRCPNSKTRKYLNFYRANLKTRENLCCTNLKAYKADRPAFDKS